MSDRYTVINEEEPRGQSVAENGIRSIMAENHILTEKLHAINKLLNDLYEGIDENYTEALENNDELTIIRAKTELDLITKILDEVEEI